MAFGTLKRLLSACCLACKQRSAKDAWRLLRFRLSGGNMITMRRKQNARWAYISYIPEAIVRNDPEFLNFHQNTREMKVIADCFLNHGFNIVVQHYQSKIVPPPHEYDIIFGLEPNFVLCAEKHPDAKTVYYATGAYVGYANRSIVQRTSQFNSRYGTDIPPRRLAMDDGSAGKSDCILQIGTANTIETYPEAIQPKIRLIHQSSNLLSNDFRRTGFKKTKFLWLGSSGSILKGVDLVIEAFLRHPELEIDIVGPVENEVKAVYARQLHNTSNIRFHGYVDVNSHRFMNIVSDTAFLIYPSVTEGGFPGAVIAGMKLGLVPLVSKIAAPECIESCGYQLNDISLHSIEQALQWSQNLSENQIKERSDAVVQYSTLFSIERFGQEFNRFLDDICRTAASN
jgi:glycosyltransferase involved in cell wall biosynthesis